MARVPELSVYRWSSVMSRRVLNALAMRLTARMMTSITTTPIAENRRVSVFLSFMARRNGRSAGAQVAEDHACGKEREHRDGGEEDQVSRIQHPTLEAEEMPVNAEGIDQSH